MFCEQLCNDTRNLAAKLSRLRLYQPAACVRHLQQRQTIIVSCRWFIHERNVERSQLEKFVLPSFTKKKKNFQYNCLKIKTE